MTRPKTSDAEIKAALDGGMTFGETAASMQVSVQWVYSRAKLLGLSTRQSRRGKDVKPKPDAKPKLPPIRVRADYPDMLAAIARAKGNPKPQAALSAIATRFRLPVPEITNIAERIWK